MRPRDCKTVSLSLDSDQHNGNAGKTNNVDSIGLAGTSQRVFVKGGKINIYRRVIISHPRTNRMIVDVPMRRDLIGISFASVIYHVDVAYFNDQDGLLLQTNAKRR